MWVVTTRGFYSVVAHKDDPELVRVRARSKADIDKLYAMMSDEYMTLCLDDVSQPYAGPHADYLWRIDMPRRMWEILVGLMVREINYPNFKAEVDRRQGRDRHDVYAAVWSTLLGLEPRGERAQQREDSDA